MMPDDIQELEDVFLKKVKSYLGKIPPPNQGESEMNDSNDGAAVVIVILGIIFMFLGIGYGMGSTFSKYDYIPQGRNEGIIFCIENKKQCRTEYDYLKLKEEQSK